jgi:hypothetical protein
MAEQELDLLQIAAIVAAEFGARAAEIVGAEVLLRSSLSMNPITPDHMHCRCLYPFIMNNLRDRIALDRIQPELCQRPKGSESDRPSSWPARSVRDPPHHPTGERTTSS